MSTNVADIEEFADDSMSDISSFLANNFNQTALAILYERLNRQRECMDREFKEPRCEETGLYRLLMGYGFLVLCSVAVIGNCLNLLVYISDQIRFFIAIRMLCTKLLVNTLTMLVLLPQACRSVGLWEAGSLNDRLYWEYWPYQAFFGNFFGFTGMWLTVLMTAECYVHVFLPLKSKVICTMKNVWRSYVVIAVMATILGLIYPLNRSVVLSNDCDRVEVQIVVTDSKFMGIYERFHMLANMLFAIIVPLALLVFMTSCIVWRLVGKAAMLKKQNSQKKNVGRFGSEKRSVTQITLITTVFQLFGELPSVPIFMMASLFAPGAMENMSTLCFWQSLSQFLGLCNVSLSFFVYIAFSPRFRKAILTRCRRNNKYFHALSQSLHYSKAPSSKHDSQSKYPSTPAEPPSTQTSVYQQVDGRLSVECSPNPSLLRSSSRSEDDLL